MTRHDTENDRVICTAEQPAKRDGRRYLHPDAKSDGECSDGCCDYYLCQHCGIRFRVEVPQ